MHKSTAEVLESTCDWVTEGDVDNFRYEIVDAGTDSTSLLVGYGDGEMGEFADGECTDDGFRFFSLGCYTF